MMKIIACEIFRPYLELLSVESDIDYLEMESHHYPHKLTRMIQEKIDNSKGYSQILLLYGLCGNALLDIQVRDIPIYVVRVHDCLGILLGGHQRFERLFHDRLSSGWSCYSLECQKHLCFDEYDCEEREYLESIFHSWKHIYVSFQMDKEKEYAKRYSEVIIGDLNFLKEIVTLHSTQLLKICHQEFLIYDEKEIMKKSSL